MKFPFIYILCIGAFCHFILSGSASGPTQLIGDRTLSPTSGGACNGCHANPGDFTPTTTITLKDAAGNPVTNGLYKPGHTYSLRVSVFSPQVGGVSPQYGLQTVLMTNNYTQAGTLSNPTTGSNGFGSGAQLYWFGGRSYLEHNQRNPNGIFNATWVAPAVGTGPVSIYSMGLAVNANSAFTGDNHDGASLILQEDMSIGVDKIASNDLEFTISPNPSYNRTVVLRNLKGEANIQVINSLGIEVYSKKDNFSEEYLLDLNHLAGGLYFIRIQQDKRIGLKELLLY